ncbi:MAG: UDP-N-acetylmuramoyl-L-alanine--D-glutamate ligase [Sneathiella sp.]
MMDSRAYQNKNVAVFGLGKSGFATAKRLHEGHARVSVWDDNEDRRTEAQEIGLTVSDMVGGGWQKPELLILSPGVPLTHPTPHSVVKLAKTSNTEIIGDIEVFLNEKSAGKVVGITGTNGKSTTTALIHHILASCGREAALGGNFGTPVMDLPQLSDDGSYILELSSYQLDLTPSWRADIAIILNITPDHLDRHGDMAGYVAIKERIFQHQTEDDVAVVNFDDPICREMGQRLKVTGRQSIVPISVEEKLTDGVSVLSGLLVDNSVPGSAWSLDISEIIGLRGRHNWQNAAAAVATVRKLGLSDTEIQAGLESFKGLAHRMELVALEQGLRFVNDSKATNAEAAEKALASFDNIYWICGGIAKAGGIETLSPYFQNIAHAYLIGEAEDLFANTLEGHVDYTKCCDLETATRQAITDARAKNADATILLSPASASFDQFPSFEARGDAFRDLVRRGIE